MDVVDEVRRRGGVMPRSRLPRAATRSALAAGRLVAPRRGLVALAELPAEQLLALQAGGVLSCASAAAALGLDLLDGPGVPHITVPRGVRVCVPDGVPVVFHRRDVPTDGLTTTMSRAAADCARCLEPVPALVVVDSALRAGLAREQIEQHLWGRGSAAPLALVRQGDPRSQSSGETVARVTIEQSGLSVEPQVHIPGVGWVDLLVEGKVVVEIDGFSYHSDAAQFTTDRRRDAALVAMGYRVLRFTWADAVRRPEYVLSMVRRALAQAS